MNVGVQHKYGGMMDSQRLRLGRDIAKIIMENSLDYPPGTRAHDPKGKVTELLEGMGFGRIEYYNIDHDILLIGLWRYEDNHLVDEFFLEFSGTDVLYLTLLCADEPGHQVEV